MLNDLDHSPRGNDLELPKVRGPHPSAALSSRPIVKHAHRKDTNWRGQPLVSHDVVVNLIGNTTTQSDLRIRVELDVNKYQLERKVPDEEFSHVNLQPNSFHGEWNYTGAALAP